MANTTSIQGNIIEITGLDSDWQMSSDTPYTLGAKVKSILFEPGTGGTDTISITEGSTSGPVLMFASTTDTNDQKIRYFNEGVWMDPVIDISDCTISTNARVSIVVA